MKRTNGSFMDGSKTGLEFKMSILSKILSPVTSIISGVLDKTVVDKNERERLKQEIAMALITEGEAQLEAQAKIIVAEANGSFLQRNWRPATMVTFVALVVLRWLGLTDTTITPELEIQLMELIKIGLGGYVVGRSAEKIASSWNRK